MKISDVAGEALGNELAGAVVADQIMSVATDENVENLIDHTDALIDRIHADCSENAEGQCQCNGRIVHEQLCSEELNTLIESAAD